MIIGVTGGSGTGKTTLSQMFGYPVINADEVYHEILEKDANLQKELDENFGTHSRPELSKIVFHDAEKLKLLNEITHKYIVEEIETRIHGDVVIDAAVLFESGLDQQCEKTIALVASHNVRLQRIMERDGLSEEAAHDRLSAQQSDEYYIRHADYVIINDGSEEDLRKHAERLQHQLYSRVAIYGGTFDPPTLGHLDVIRRASRLFDKLYVVALVNHDKKPAFELDERIEMLRSITGDLTNVNVAQFDGLLAEYAYMVGAHYSVRGVRSGFDMDYERPLFEFNSIIAADHHEGYELDTIFIPTTLENFDTSSSNIRILLNAGALKTAARYIDPRIMDLIEAKYPKKN